MRLVPGVLPPHKAAFLLAATTFGPSGGLWLGQQAAQGLDVLPIIPPCLIRMVRLDDHLVFFPFLDPLLEIADSFAQCSAKLGKFARSEDDQHQCENDEQFLSSQSEHEKSFRCCGVEIIKSRLMMGSLTFRVQGR